MKTIKLWRLALAFWPSHLTLGKSVQVLFSSRLIGAFAMLAAFSLASCSSESLDGDWDSMKWSKTDYKVVKEDGTKYYYVPKEGIEFIFTCKNYGPWLSSVKAIMDDNIEYIYPNDDFHSIDYESIHVKAEGKTVTVSFDPIENDRQSRRYMLTVTAGDVFDYFCFIQ